MAKTKKFYVSFGQCHTHRIPNHTIDKDVIVVIEAVDEAAARQQAFNVFGSEWGFMYKELPPMEYFPRGLINL